MTGPAKVRLGEVLVEQGLLTKAQLDSALAEQKQSARKLGRIIVERGLVPEEAISRALGKQLGIPFVDLRHFNVRREIVRRLGENQARRLRAVVLDDRDSVIRVGLADPTNLAAYDELLRILGKNVELAVVTESDLLATIDRIYQRTEEISTLAKELTQEVGDFSIDFGGLLDTTPRGEDAPVVRLLQTIFEDAVRVRASDIHIEPQEKTLNIRFRIDGVLHLQIESDMKIASALVQRLKLMAGLDISERRLPQDGRFNVKVRNNPVDVRMSTMPTQWGESVVMRLLTQAGGVLGLERLGMPPRILERLRHTIHRTGGMVLVTGPTGSGKTTTLYAMLSEINTPEKKIITVEDPVEYRLPGINQVQVHDRIELTFERVLRSALRQDPDVIMVGEIRDRVTAETGLRAAITGHMVFSTLHTNDAVGTPIRLLDMGVPRYMVAMSLQLVVAQRLVRVNCVACAEEYVPDAAEMTWLGEHRLDEADRPSFRRGRGCSHCNGTGFRSRIGIFEMLEMTRPVVEAANHEDPVTFVRVAREQMGDRTLRNHAARLVLAGKTTAREAMRVDSELEE
ncbi:MAG TPA: GspE/PulE family protein [Usitatibacteraceae bacterium]|nr:GspE/PulE family protein [Usitatibacteraceae bacterium]